MQWLMANLGTIMVLAAVAVAAGFAIAHLVKCKGRTCGSCYQGVCKGCPGLCGDHKKGEDAGDKTCACCAATKYDFEALLN